jgi:hypothetical protein
VGKDGVQRIWRREGLKVPQKQTPRGQTPFLYPCFNCPKLSALSAVTSKPHAYLRPVRGTITSPHVRFVRECGGKLIMSSCFGENG